MKFEDKTVKSTLTLVNCLHDFPDFPDRERMREAWKREHMFGLSLFRPSRQSNIPYPGRTRSVKCPTPGTTKTIKSPPHALPPPPPPPAGLTLIGALSNVKSLVCNRERVKPPSIKVIVFTFLVTKSTMKLSRGSI